MGLMDFSALLTAAAGLVTIVLTVVKYLSRRDMQIAARDVFQNVVNSLSSEIEVQRLGGAILLRRFFNPETELGEGGTPYAREAMNVIGAILRDTEAGNFQKLLADGLRFAPSLEQADLQRTNLQKAYLGSDDQKTINLNRADFYRADLSGASLKGASATNTVFYQARLHNTVFKNADLSNSNFFEADLLGANFMGARLDGASFLGARNIPRILSERLESDGRYVGQEAFMVPNSLGGPRTLTVFLSRPGTLNSQQRDLVAQLLNLLEKEGLEAVTVEREEYPSFGAVAEVRRVMSGCVGAVILGFRQLEVQQGIWRVGTEEAHDVRGIALATAWNHFEAGMAAMAGLPTLFFVEKGVKGGLLESRDIDDFVTDIDLAKPDYSHLQSSVSTWCRAVRERSHC